MSIRTTRERINLSIYGQKAGVLKAMRIMSLLVSLLAVLTLIIYHGFPHAPETKSFLLKFVKGSFAFFIFHYFLRIFYDFHPLKFIKRNWFEGLLMLLLIIDGIGDLFFHTLIIERFFVELGIKYYPVIATVFIQLYLFVVIVMYILRSTTIIPKIKLNPAILFVLSFVIMILGGTLLLLLPEMTTIEGSMPFIDALFTATSANCVTGLIVVDTATYFTFKGQFIILVLLKLGGLNIVMFGTFVALASKFGFGVKHHQVIEGFVSRETVLSSKGMMQKIFIWSLIIEAISSAFLFLFWSPDIPFKSIEDKVFFSVFHSMSAFNNAGFSLFTDGLYNEYARFNYMVHIVIAGTIFLGSLGFVAMFDLFSITNLRQRLKLPWKDVGLGTKIALNFSLILVFGGALVFFLIEYGKSLNNMNVLESMITSFFQSIATRTAGFNTLDIGSLSLSVLILFMFLMFIGASSSSTGGGVKTSSIALLLASVYSTIHGKKNIELFKRNIPAELINNAIAIIIFYCFYMAVSLFILSYFEEDMLLEQGFNFIDLMFEQVSAMSTVGLSTGITGYLSTSGKTIIILSMFIGRVGALTIVFALAKRAISTNYKYPNGRMMVG